jgi:hypothetical protein
MATANIMVLAALAAAAISSVCCTSSVIFIRKTRLLNSELNKINEDIRLGEEAIAALNADKPPNLEQLKLLKPQNMTPRTGAFRVPTWSGCLYVDKDEVKYTESEPSKCTTDFVVQPLQPLSVYLSTSNIPDLVTNAFLVKHGDKYLARNRKLVATQDEAVRLRHNKDTGTLEVVPLVADSTKAKYEQSYPCWHIESKKLREETDRAKYQKCAPWQVP